MFIMLHFYTHSKEVVVNTDHVQLFRPSLDNPGTFVQFAINDGFDVIESISDIFRLIRKE